MTFRRQVDPVFSLSASGARPASEARKVEFLGILSLAMTKFQIDSTTLTISITRKIRVMTKTSAMILLYLVFTSGSYKEYGGIDILVL